MFKALFPNNVAIDCSKLSIMIIAFTKIITALDKAVKALEGKTGTHIIPD